MTSSLDREYRLTDQALSMHSLLRDRLKRRAKVFNGAVLLGSAVSVVLAAFDAELRDVTGLEPPAVRIGLAVAAASALVGGILERYSDTTERAGLHAVAASQFAGLKHDLSLVRRMVDPPAEVVEDLRGRYSALSMEVAPIPDAKFASLKLHHLRKVELSRRVSARPEVPLWVHRVGLLWSGLAGRRRS